MATENSRAIRVRPESEAGVLVKDTEVSIIGDSRHFVNVDERGVTLRGPISIVSTSESIRRGGLFVGLNDFMEQIPSTIVTPLPRNIEFPPYFMLANVGLDIAHFLAFLV